MKKEKNKKEKNKKEKKEIVGFRVTDSEKKRLEKEAKKAEMTVSDYIRDRVMGARDKTQFTAKDAICIITLAIDIVRYVEDRYGSYEDPYLRERVEELCQKLC